MPVVKGGVWTNIEDEILKAAVSKYGLNQWARVSSLLARKTPKQCKARWSEWLDPSIRKIEWSREEDEKLLHLAKLMPTQWRTIAPIVGRTATQCLERYQKLLDEAEARENAEELGLGGPEGGETAAPSADDVRKLRPGEVDPDPESKPARPDTIDMDEDEKEMLSEARARLANTQGKKAKRKARERQLEESRRLAVLQKRRELKNAGINVKVTTRKKGQMDYNADIPFEKAPAPGFYDTQEELAQNERAREMFDPRKQQLANKRKGDGEEAEHPETKRMKNNKGDSGASAFAAAAKAGQQQRIREAEMSSKRRSLNLPAPQVSEGELEDIVKMGMSGERASTLAEGSENENTRGLIGNYQNQMVGATPIRTPRAPQEEDRIANELRNARARTETQSALFGGENNELVEDSATTGYQGVTPSQKAAATPNPMATPFRQGMANGAGATPRGPGATPMRTPRDNFRLNENDGSMQLVGQTPRDVRMQEQAQRSSLRSKLASLPKPKETEFELELPEERAEAMTSSRETYAEDAAARDKRNAELAHAAAMAEFRRQTQTVQRGLPRPKVVDIDAMLKNARDSKDPIERDIEEETALLMANDALKFGGAKVNGSARPVEIFAEEALQKAKMEVVLEMGQDADRSQFGAAFEKEWEKAHESQTMLPGLAGYGEDELDEEQLLVEQFDNVQDAISASAEKSAATEKRLTKHHGGYLARQKVLKTKIQQAAETLEKTRLDVEVGRAAEMAEQGAMQGRLEQLRDEVGLHQLSFFSTAPPKMQFMLTIQAVLGLATASRGQVYNTYNSITALSAMINASSSSTLGNYYNYWKLTDNDTTYDLTRSDRMPVSSPKIIPMIGSREKAIIEPNRTAMVIVDMQNFFLHPQLSPAADKGRAAVQPTLNMIEAFRANELKVLWVQWGIDNYDLLTMPPALLDQFSDDHSLNSTFCTEMGTIKEENGTEVDLGKKLCRGSWNAQPYGPLYPAMLEGTARGTDYYFNKNRLSGLWGAQTPLGLYLQESGITTLFLGGVNSDQCVWSTLIDAYFKGFDVVYVEDIAGTTSPWYAEQMVRYNANSDGFLANSSYIIDALNAQSGNDFFLEDPTASALARRRAVRQAVTDPDRAHLRHALAWHESQLNHAVWCRQVADAGRFQYARDTITGKVSYFAGTTEQFDAIVVRPAGDEEETSGGGLRTATADMKDPGLNYASRLEQPPASAPPRVSLQKVKALSRCRASRRGYRHPHGESQVVRTPYQWHGRAQSRFFPEAGHGENEAGGSKPDSQATEEATQDGSEWLNKMHPNTPSGVVDLEAQTYRRHPPGMFLMPGDVEPDAPEVTTMSQAFRSIVMQWLLC
ncbi:Pre-mRNA-splicing factor [Hortaea werneckii]|nr:Pre-mRNA-splicing factor [Hortaea werneckii]